METTVEDFIANNVNRSVAELALLLSKKTNWPKDYILNQIQGKQKAAKKYPFLLKYNSFKYPSSRAIEQSSSALTAQYKASLLNGKSAVDLSGGMGIDSYFLAKKFERLDYVERNAELCELTKHNLRQVFQLKSVTAHNMDAVSFLRQKKESIDWVYIDPDRRATKSKAFLIEDCEPNIADLLIEIQRLSKHCLIKLSPMLDISQAIEQLQTCKEVHVLTVKNDCKELLFVLEKGFEGEPSIFAKELAEGIESSFHFLSSEEKDLRVELSDPLSFLYEPNTAILKSGAFKSVAQQYGLKKLAINTHLYTSEDLVQNFPGRVLKINRLGSPQKGMVKKANVVCKNFSLSPAELKKKYKIQDGGNEFLYACSLSNEKKLFILAEKV